MSFLKLLRNPVITTEAPPSLPHHMFSSEKYICPAEYCEKPFAYDQRNTKLLERNPHLALSTLACLKESILVTMAMKPAILIDPSLKSYRKPIKKGGWEISRSRSGRTQPEPSFLETSAPHSSPPEMSQRCQGV